MRMVAVISSTNLGLFTANGSARGAPGSPGNGQAPDQVYVNTTTGNLVLQNQDESLAAVGLGLSLIRTYNSQGLLDDDNGDNWRLGFHQRVYGQTGPVNTDGSMVRKVFGDGADVLYTYVGSQYVSTDGDGAHDTLSFAGGTWTWREGSTGRIETYNSNGQLTTSRDADGNTVTYGYTNGLLTSITDASSQVTTLTYSGTDLTGISVTSGGQTQSRTRYSYDGSHRLRQVIVDLTPANAFTLVDANSDGLYETVNAQTYVTTYTYVGATKLVASITHGDGSSVSFVYQSIDGKDRVTSVTDGLGRTTTISYANVIPASGPQTANANPAALLTTDTTNIPYSLNSAALTTPSGGGPPYYAVPAGATWQSIANVLYGINSAAAGTALQTAMNNITLSTGLQLTGLPSTLTVSTQYALNTSALTTPSGGAGWATPTALESSSVPVTDLQVVSSNAGYVVATWVQGGQLYARLYDAESNTWGTATLLSGASTTVTAPRLAVNFYSGEAIATWIDGGNQVRANRLAYDEDTDTTFWRGSETVATVSSGTLSEVSGSIGPWGYSSVSWLETNGTTRTVRASVRGESSWGSSMSVASVSDAITAPRVMINAEGVVQVFWRRTSSGVEQLYTRGYYDEAWSATTQLSTSGSTNVSQFRVDTDLFSGLSAAFVQGNSIYFSWGWGGDEWDPAELIATSSSAVTDLAYAFTQEDASFAWVNADGQVWVKRSDAAAELVATATGATQLSVDGNNEGTTVVSWRSGNDLYAARYVGSAWSAAQLVESGSGAVSSAVVVIGDQSQELDSQTVAVFIQNDGTANTLFATRYTTTGGGGGAPYYTVPSGATWQSIAAALYGINSAAAGTALQTAMNNVALTTGAQLTGFPASLSVSTTHSLNTSALTTPGGGGAPYYTVPSGATWQSIANVLYGVNSAAAGTALQTVMNNVTLSTGLQLSGFPATLSVSISYSLNTSALTTPSGGGAGWMTPTALESSSSAASGLQVVSSGWEIAVATWEQGGQLYASLYDIEAQVWGAAAVISGSSTAVTGSRVSVDWSSGQAIATWINAGNQVHANRLLWNGGTQSFNWQGDETLATVSTTLSDVSGSTGDGAFAVSWLETDGATRTVRSRYRSGSSWGSASQVVSATSAITAPLVSVSGEGVMQVVWRQTSGGVERLYARGYAGSWSSAVQISASGSANVGLFRTATAPWADTGIFFSQGNAVYVRWGWGTTDWDDLFQLGSSSGTITDIAFPAAGWEVATAAWTTSDGNIWMTYGDEPELVASATSPTQLTLDHNDEGEVIVSWRSGNDVYAATRSAAGTWGSAQLLESASGAASAPYAFIDEDGRATAAFLQNDGTANSVFATRYSQTGGGGGPPYYTVPSGATWQSIASALYGINSAAAGSALQTAMNNVTLTTGAQLTGFPATLTVSTGYSLNSGALTTPSGGGGTPYYLVPAGATWQSIAYALYGINSIAAGNALQTAMGSPTLSTGLHLTPVPATLTVQTVVTVPAYYLVQSGDTWTSITQAVYNTNNANAVAALQSALNSPALTPGLHLSVPATLTYGSGTGNAGYLESHVIDPLGNESTYLHDSQGRLTRTFSPMGIRTDYAYDGDGNLISITEDVGGLNRLTSFEYQSGTGNLLRTRDGAGNSTYRTYSATNQVLTETVYLVEDQDGGSISGSSPLTTRYIYDGEDHIRFLLTPGGGVIEYRYNPAGQRTAMLVYDEVVYNLASFNENTLPTLTELTNWAATQQGSRITRVDYAYDFRGLLTSSTAFSNTDATGAGVTAGSSKTQYVYDQRGQLLQVITPRGSGNTPNAANANIEYATTFTYDGLGRVLTSQQWTATGTVSQVSTSLYDDVGNKTVTTDAAGLVGTVQYDAAGRMISAQNTGPAVPSGSITEYKYDNAGRLRLVVDPAGVRKHQLFDSDGRKIADIDADGSLTEYVYDRLNQLVKVVRYSDAVPAATLSSLVVSGAPANVSLATIKASLPTTPETGRARDQITRNVYDAAGRLVYTIDAVGAVSKQIYDGASHVTKTVRYAVAETIPSGTDVLSVSQMAGLVDEGDPNNRVSRNFYDADGNLRGTLDAEGYLVEYTYDVAGRLQKKTAYATQTPASPASLRATGTLDQLRPASDTTITTLSPEQDSVDLYFYDSQDRLIGHLDGEGYLTDTQYDVSGNVSQTTRYDVSLTYGGQSYIAFRDAIATSVVRHTTTYQYDGANRLTSEVNFQGSLTGYGYNAAGRRVWTAEAYGTADQRMTQARYDALGRVIGELSGEGRIALDQLLASNPSATQTQIDDIWVRYGVTYSYDAAGRLISRTERPSDPVNGTQINRTLYFYDGDGQLRFTVNPAGERVERKYNALGQVTEEKAYFNALSPSTLSGLSGGLLTSGLISTLTGSTHASDASTTFRYELSGLLDTSVDGEGSTVVNDYTVFGELLTSTTADATQNNVRRYTYDKRGQLRLTEWNPAAIDVSVKRTETLAYDAFGRIKSVTDQYNQKTETHYDRLGRTLESLDALGNKKAFTYDAFSRTMRVYDAYNNYTQYAYDDAQRSVTATTPEGIAVTTRYTRNGQTLSVTAAGNTTTYSYDDNGNVIGISDSLGTLETRVYDTEGREVTRIDARNVTTRLRYDAAGRILTRTVETGGESLVTTYEYDGLGRVKKVTEPSNKVTTTTYDRQGRLKDVIVDPGALNLRTHYDYDTANRTVTVTEDDGSATPAARRIVRYGYDVKGRRISETVLMQGTATTDLLTEYRYDANDNLVRKIDAEGHSTWYVYDADQRLKYTVDALGGVAESIYDNESRVIATREYAQAISTTGFNDRVTSLTLTTSVNDRIQQSVYDRDGRERYSIDSMGTVTQHTYDASGNLIRNRTFAKAVNIVNGQQLVVFAQGATVSAALTAIETALTSATNSLTAIAASDRVEWGAYDARGRRVLAIDGLGYVARFQYDAGGNLEKITQYATALASGAIADDVTGLTATTGGLTVIRPSGNTSLTFATDANRDRVTRTWYDAVNRVRFVLDAEGYLTETRHADSARTVSDITYAAKNIVTGAETAAAVATAVAASAVANNALNQKTNTVYDAAGRIYRVYDASNNYEEYSYDAVGNKTKFRNKKGAEWTYQYDANHRLLSETTPAVAYTVLTRSSSGISAQTSTGPLVTKFEYDDLGNVRFRIEADNVPSQKRTTEYQYDAVSRQTKVLHPAVKVYNGGSADFGSTASETGPVVLYTEVTYDALGNAISSRDTAGSYAHKGYDRLGRVIWELDSERYLTEYQYDAFGNVTQVRRVATPYDSQTGPASALRPTLNPAALPTSSGDRVLVKRYDRVNRVYEIETPSTYRYDPVTHVTYQASGLTSYQYNAFGQVILESTAVDQSRVANTYSYYDRRGLKTAQVDALGYLTTYEYDDSTGDLTRRVEYAKPAGGTITTASPPAATPAPAQTSFTDASGYDRETRFTYDLLNRTTSEKRIGIVQGSEAGAFSIVDQETTYGYDLLGNQTRITHKNVRGYDAGSQGWVVADANTYTYYDVLGRITAIAEPVRDRGDGTDLTPLTTMKRDAFGNLVEQMQYANGATLGANEAGASPVGADASRDRVSRFYYDVLGHVTQSEDATGADRFASYNARGEVAKEWQPVTNPADATSGTIVTIYEYDSLGRQLRVIEPQQSGASVGVTRTVTYNAFGEVTNKSTSGIEGVETYEYDLAGNVWRTNSKDGVYKVYLYDRAGNATLQVKSQFNASGSTNLNSATVTAANVVGTAGTIRTETVYDLLGRVTQQREPSFSVAPTTVTFNPAPQVVVVGTTAYLAWTPPVIDSTLQAQVRIDGTIVTIGDVDGSENGYRPGGSLQGVATGTHSYQISYVRSGDAQPIFTASGTFHLNNNSTTTIGLTTTFSTGQVASITASGTSISWTMSGSAPAANFEVLVGGTWQALTSSVYENSLYYVTLPTLTTGTYQYRLTHVTNGRTDVAASGTFTYTAASSSAQTTLTITPGTDSSSAVGTLAVVSGSTLRWAAALTVGDESGFSLQASIQLTQGSTTVTPTVTYTDTSWVRTFSASTGTLAAGTWQYTVTITRNGTIAGAASGTVTSNGSGTLTIVSQAPAYPSVTTLAGLTDRGNGVMSWDNAATSGSTVEVRYRQPPSSGTWSAWNAASAYGSGYSFNFSSLSGVVEYEIRYSLSGTPYLRAVGQVNVTISTQNTPASASGATLTNAAAITGFTDLGAGYFGWTTAPANTNDVRVFRYRPAGTSTWTTLTPQLSGSYYRVLLGSLSGSYDFEVEYRTSSTSPTAYALGSGTISIATQVNTTGSSFVDTSSSTPVTVTPQQTQSLDRWGNVVSLVDRAGQTTQYRYNQSSQLIKTIQPNVTVVDVAGRTEANPGSITSSTAAPVSFNYYDAYGRLAATRDANGNLNALAYNAAGQILRENHADGGIKRFVNDIFAQQVSITDEMGYETRREFDRGGRLTAVAQELTTAGLDSYAAYSIPGFLASANVIVKRYIYDEAGRRIAETTGEQTRNTSGNPTGLEQTIRYWYDLHGNMVRLRAIGAAADLSFTFDGMGRKIADPGNSKTWEYDYFGHLTGHKDLGGYTYSYTYDTNSWLLKVQTNTRGLNQTYNYNQANDLISITDTGVGRTTEYRYDAAGRLAREIITVTSGTQPTQHQDTLTEYDALGRIKHLSGIGYSVDYEYDAAGNRTHIHAAYAVNGGTQHQNLWYQYDAMNRVTVSQGVNASGVVTIDVDNGDLFTQGTSLVYNARGDRTASVTYGPRYRSAGSSYSVSQGESMTQYAYDGAGRLTQTSVEVLDESGQSIIVTDARVYDRASRVITGTTATVEGNALITRVQTTVYSDDGLVKSQTTTRNGVQEAVLQYGTGVYGNESGYDAAGNVLGYVVTIYQENGTTVAYTSTNTFTYDTYESYVERTHAVTNSAVIANGATERRYNVNGELVQFVDQKSALNNQYFVNNSQGKAITVVKGNFGDYGQATANNELRNAGLNAGINTGNRNGYFLFANDGSYVGSVTQIGGLKAKFDVNFTPISSQYPASVPASYVVQSGDTLRIIAAKVFGDAALWYVIAEANGLSDPDGPIPEGRSLTIPNEVVTPGNNASTFKPFDIREALGDTTPTQPVIPQPRNGGVCGIIGMIIVIVVAIVVTVLSEGTASGIWEWVFQFMGPAAAETAGGVMGVATAAALGSAASQLTAMAIGLQDDFSWNSVATAALTAGLTKGMGLDSLLRLPKGVPQSDIFNVAIQGAMNSAIGQGVNMAMGLQDKFSWTQLAVAAVSAPIAGSLERSVGTRLDPNFGADGYEAGFGVNLVSGMAKEIGTTAVRLAFGGKVETAGAIADIFGHALGNSIAKKIQGALAGAGKDRRQDAPLDRGVSDAAEEVAEEAAERAAPSQGGSGGTAATHAAEEVAEQAALPPPEGASASSIDIDLSTTVFGDFDLQSGTLAEPRTYAPGEFTLASLDPYVDGAQAGFALDASAFDLVMMGTGTVRAAAAAESAPLLTPELVAAVRSFPWAAVRTFSPLGLTLLLSGDTPRPRTEAYLVPETEDLAIVRLDYDRTHSSAYFARLREEPEFLVNLNLPWPFGLHLFQSGTRLVLDERLDVPVILEGDTLHYDAAALSRAYGRDVQLGTAMTAHDGSGWLETFPMPDPADQALLTGPLITPNNGPLPASIVWTPGQLPPELLEPLPGFTPAPQLPNVESFPGGDPAGVTILISESAWEAQLRGINRPLADYTNQEVGALGERIARTYLEEAGFTDIYSVQNASGNGLDLVATGHDGRLGFFEIKTSRVGEIPDLSKRQTNADVFIRDVLGQASTGTGRYKGLDTAQQDRARATLRRYDSDPLNVSRVTIGIDLLNRKLQRSPW